MSQIKDLKSIIESNEEMLTYFNRLFSEHEATLQEYKASLFEVNIKIDELNRTKSVYSYSTDYRKDVFSPISIHSPESEKENELKKEINSLTKSREEYEYKVNEETIYLKSIDKRIQKLTKAKKAIEAIYSDEEKKEEQIKREKEKKFNEELAKHLNNIQLINAFDQRFTSTLLDKRLKKELLNDRKKLELIKTLINNKPAKAKASIEEIINNNIVETSIIDEQLNRSNYYFDEKMPLEVFFHDYISKASDRHPSIAFDYTIDKINRTPNYLEYLSLYKLLNIFFENIYKHSKATHVEFEVIEDKDGLNITIKDNGIGINKASLQKTQCYNGINRAKELIFLLSGNIEIEHMDPRGTKVYFCF